MKKIYKTILLSFFAFITAIVILTNTSLFSKAEEQETSGKCGDNVYWSFEKETGTLELTGYGEMKKIVIPTPWQEYKPEITAVKIEDGITNIMYQAFSGCENLTDVNIPSSVLEISGEAFSGCNSLETIRIPDGVEIIAGGAFASCEKLKNVYLPTTIKTILEKAFWYSEAITNVYLEGELREWCETEIGHETYVFRYAENVYLNGILITDLEISSDVTEINDNVFAFLPNLETLKIPSSVKTIGGYAFDYCLNLKTVELSDGLETIGQNAFCGCENLKNLNLGNTVKVIGNYAFSDCKTLEEVKLPESVEEIGVSAFGYCENLDKINIPSKVTEIKLATFSNTALESIEIPENVTEIGKHAFEFTPLKSIVIPGNVKTVGEAFFYCRSLTEVTIEDGVETLNASFEHCENLRFIEVPASVKSIGNYTFYHCYNLTVHIPPETEVSRGAYVFNGVVEICSTTDEADAKAYVDEYNSEYPNYKPLKFSVCTGQHSWIDEENPDEPEQNLPEQDVPEREIIEKKNDKCDITVCFSKEILEEEINADEITLSVASDIEEHKKGSTNVYDEKLEKTIGCYDIKLIYKNSPLKFNGKVTVKIPIPEEYKNAQDFNVAHIHDDESRENFSTYSKNENKKIIIENGYLVFKVSSFSKFEIYAVETLTFSSFQIREPSVETVSYGDSLVLHADFEGVLPEGGYIKWTADNAYFSINDSADGKTCTVSPEASGSTVFTATVYDADGTELAKDEQTITAKAGIFVKIIAFFKKLFGLTRIIPEVLKTA